MGPSMLGVFVSIDSIRRVAHDLDMKFALILSTLDFDSAMRGYLTTPLALRFLESRRNAGRESSRVPAGSRGHPGAPCISAVGKGTVASCGLRLADRRMGRCKKKGISRDDK